MSGQSLTHHLQALSPELILSAQGDLSCVVTAPFVEAHTDLLAGGVFIARHGRSIDGHAFIPDAIAAGAVAIIGEDPPADWGLPYVQARDAQQATGWLAASYYEFPSRSLIIAGVTGTDGKTTTSHLLHSILRDVTGQRAGFISTIAADFGGRSVETGLHVTTPGAPQVQAFLAQMRDAGLSHVVLEMTSHGLAQGRLNGVDIDVAILTNITHEHLDYHGSWEAYRDAKALMFRMLGQSQRKEGQAKLSVLNADDPSCGYLAAIPADQHLLYGLQTVCDFQANEITYSASGTQFRVGQQHIESNLLGEFNVYNVLAAIAGARALGYTAVQAGITSVKSVSGRMQHIDEGQAFGAIVDFAHTPNALRVALQAGREMLVPGQRLIAVFGSAGLRDVEKRRLMAETSARLADLTILSAEDPRTESLDAILEMMAEGCRSQGAVEGESFLRIPDRGEAIYRACRLARPGDLVMVCGKGHEQSMCFGTVEHAWDDREALRAALILCRLPTAHAAAD